MGERGGQSMPDRLGRIEEIYHAASELRGRERDEFLSTACGDDADLRAEIESLLAESGTFMDDAARAAAALAADTERELPLPATIGPFRIIGLIGEGGMGRVYEAEQDSPRRRVALKVIRPGVLTRGALRRFAHEAEVLAQLKHPGIAQIYQSGRVSVGGMLGSAEQPYFAMELVRGPTLTAFARERNMSVPQRMELLARVCDAVQHAHQRGVIHRDLKPGNILIELADDAAADRCTPKILDFGIAKLANQEPSQTFATQTGQVVGTLAYMSPEQIGGGLGLDTRGDVYALGVIGYELLAGKVPIDVAHLQLAEAARRIHDEDPARLGSMHHQLRGDVETIIAKAIEKDPQRRYSTAAELAADIRRWLHDEPIAARPASSLYQLRKFARRNRGLVGGAAAVVAALVIGATAATYLAVSENRARRLADAAARRANLSAALADLKGGNASSARQRLSQVDPAARGWEWRYLSRQCDSSFAMLPTPDGPLCLAMPRREGDPPHAPPEVLVLSSDERPVRSWHPGVRGHELKSLFNLEPGFTFAEIAADGRTLILLRGETLQAVALDDPPGRERWQHRGVGAMQSGAISMDGQQVVVSRADRELVFLDTLTGRELRQVRAPDGAARLPRFARVQLGAALATPGDAQPRTLVLTTSTITTSLIDPESGQEVTRLPLANATIVGDGRVAVGWRHSDMASLDLRTGVITPLMPIGPARIFEADPSGRLAMVSEATTAMHARDLRKGWTVRMHGHRTYAGHLNSTSDGRWLLSQSNSELRWWDLNAAGEYLVSPRSYDTVSSASISHDGRSLATIGWGSVRMWDARSGQPRWARVLAIRDTHAYIAFSPSGESLVVAGWEGVVARLDAATGRTLWRVEHPDALFRSLAWVSNASEIAIGDESGAIRMLAADDGRTIAEASPAPQQSVLAMLPGAQGREAAVLLADGRVIEGSLPAMTGAKTLLTLAPGSSRAASLAASPDGRWLLAAKGSTEASVALLDRSRPLSRDAVWPVLTHTENVGVIAATFDASSSRLVLACWDGLVRIFDPVAREETLALSPAAGYLRAVWMNDSRIVLGSSGSPVLVYDAAPDPAETAKWRMAEDARLIVEGVLDDMATSDQLIDRVNAIAILDPALRNAAITTIRGRGDHLNQLNSHAWAIVRYPGYSPGEVQSAIAAARVCCRDWPERFAYANTLGVALYRAGQFEEAIEALRRSERLAIAAGRDPHPLDGLFIVMSLLRLGRSDDAAALWPTVESAATSPSYSSDNDVQPALLEARDTWREVRSTGRQ